MPLHYGDGMDATLNLGVGALFTCDASNSGGIFGRNLSVCTLADLGIICHYAFLRPVNLCDLSHFKICRIAIFHGYY